MGELSETVSRECRGALLIAEESTSFPKVTEKPPEGGLGFDFKWNMGFMNDTLSYMSMDSVYRKWHHDKLTFPMVYAFDERFILPFSHDEMVHGKRSLIGRMNGTYDERFAQLRLLYAYQYTHPGKSCCLWAESSLSSLNGISENRLTGFCLIIPDTWKCNPL